MIIWASPTILSFSVGFFLTLTGELIRAWGVAYAGSETRTTSDVGASKLVTSGPFGFVRNPLYCGNIIMYCGIGIMSNALFPFLQLAAVAYFIFQYFFIVREEEYFLQTKFGEEYDQYKKNVPRFFPRLIAYQNKNNVRADWRSALRSESRTLQAFILVILFLLIRWYMK